MRTTVLSLVVALVALLGGFPPGDSVPQAAAAVSSAKVVIVVGATHGVTATYRTRADAAYAEAIKHTSNVVKVYSPNATWANVKAALQGASVVIYMGHGNGFPSPYRTTPWAYSQNGFGLNSSAGNGDYNNVYYGEHYIANEVRLAPNAVVLLHHLCYAAGNGEPGHAEPSVSVAKQRADNYAAGFLAAGAKAVIADGHMGPAHYLNALFTTNKTIDELWRGAPNANGNTFSFASLRSPGQTVQMDPKTPTSGFLRAVTGQLNVRASQVTGTSFAPPPSDDFTVPGNAAVAVDEAGVFADAALTPDPDTGRAPASLDRDARVRILAEPDTTGTPVFEVAAHDGSAAGFMAAADLEPGDSVAPVASNVTAGNGAFSPNADGRQDTMTVAASLSESAWWRVRFWRNGGLVWSGSGTNRTVLATWSGFQNGAVVADGAYTWTLETSDDWGNVGQARSGEVTVDTIAPTLTALSLPATGSTLISPNGDGKYDSLVVSSAMSEPGSIVLTVRDTAWNTVRAISVPGGSGSASLTWDGKSASGVVVPDGVYNARFAPVDRAGNVGPVLGRRVDVVTLLSKVLSSVNRFYPQDDDQYAPSTMLSFDLARPATVTWQITTLTGTPVLTLHDRAALPAGPQAFSWNGLDQAGRWVPTGMYVSVVSATDGVVSVTQKTWVEADAFTIRTTDATPAQGQTVEITTISSEPIQGAPVLHVTQPGLAAWAVRMTPVGGLTWKATITFRPSAPGATYLRVSALDADGRWQRSNLFVPLQ